MRRPGGLLRAAAAMAALLAIAPAQQFESLGPALPSVLSETHAVVMGDVDGDGDLDLLTGNGGGYYYYLGSAVMQNRLYLNDGRGAFTDATGQLPVDADFTTAMALGDVDGDGDLDLVVGNGYGGGQNRLYRNDGSGNFADVTASVLPVVVDNTAAIAIGDIDADGDSDIVFGNGGQNRLLLNDGAGTFSEATSMALPSFSDYTKDVALADCDGDGDLDLLVANRGQNRLLRNDGNGTFQDVTAAQMPADQDPSHSLAVGDVDGDGDLDVVVGNAGLGGGSVLTFYSPTQNRLYLNDGGGTFTDATASKLPAMADFTSSLRLGDLDGDGDLDMVATSSITPRTAIAVGGPSEFLVNDGSGAFSVMTASRFPALTTLRQNPDAALGDVDRDGDLDVVVASAIRYSGVFGTYVGGQEFVFRNLLRQLDAATAPQVGQSYQLDVYARYGVPRQFDVALSYLSLAPASVAVPGVGTIGIDLAQAAPVAPLLIPQPAGVVSTSFVVPNNASLVGLELFAQAAHLPFPLPVQLTNATRAVVQ